MQAYDIGAGQIRYDGVWQRSTSKPQTRALAWAIGDFATRFNDEVSAGRRCVHMQAYDIGGGQIRYDGVWEVITGAAVERRALSLPLMTFADHFDELTSLGFHIELMSACLRTYDAPRTLHTTAPSVRREVFFGSDFGREPAYMAPLPMEPLTVRGPGCHLRATERVP